MTQGQSKPSQSPLVVTEKSLHDTEPPQLGGLESGDIGRMRECMIKPAHA